MLIGRRFLQLILALALCIVFAGALGSLYVVAIALAAVIATASGVAIITAIALGLMWPVLVVAYVMHVTSTMRSRRQEAEDFASRPTSGKSGLRGVEDP